MLEPDKLKKLLEQAAQQLVTLVQPAIPFAGTALASGAAYTLGLGATQLAGYGLRVSCATPVLGPGMGLFGVGFASALAGQASISVQRYLQPPPARGSPVQPVRRAWQRQDLVLDAAMGILLFKMMGGNFRSLLPSDLFAAGACARESLPAPGPEYATQASKGELARLMRRDGCHHCGRHSQKTIGDHIPPNKLVHGSSNSLVQELAPALNHPAVRQARRALGSFGLEFKLPSGAAPSKPAMRRVRRALGFDPPKQRYYPQCTDCSQKQSAAARSGRRTLVLHRAGAKPFHYSGVIVGLRHYQHPPQQPPNSRPPGRLRGGWRGEDSRPPFVTLLAGGQLPLSTLITHTTAGVVEPASRWLAACQQAQGAFRSTL